MSKSNHYTGLSAREVEESRARHGVNVLTPPAKTPLWKRFLEKFEDPIIIILLIAGVFSLLISCYEFFAMNSAATVFFEPIGILWQFCFPQVWPSTLNSKPIRNLRFSIR